MKDSLFIKICLIIIILLLGLNFLFSHSKSDSNPDRYSMYIDNELAGIFKLDKQTGQIWAITLTAEGIYPVGTMFELGTIKLKPLSPREVINKALRNNAIKDSSP